MKHFCCHLMLMVMIPQPIFLEVAEITKGRGEKNRKEGNDGRDPGFWLAITAVAILETS